ncbi:hypothetical protein SGPA1_100012 [Streptomyces misionensis JCM 4497]
MQHQHLTLNRTQPQRVDQPQRLRRQAPLPLLDHGDLNRRQRRARPRQHELLVLRGDLPRIARGQTVLRDRPLQLLAQQPERLGVLQPGPREHRDLRPGAGLQPHRLHQVLGQVPLALQPPHRDVHQPRVELAEQVRHPVGLRRRQRPVLNRPAVHPGRDGVPPRQPPRRHPPPRLRPPTPHTIRPVRYLRNHRPLSHNRHVEPQFT